MATEKPFRQLDGIGVNRIWLKPAHSNYSIELPTLLYRQLDGDDNMPDCLGLDHLLIRLVLGDDLHNPLLVVVGVEHLVQPPVPLLLVEELDELVRGQGLRLGDALEQLLNVRPGNGKNRIFSLNSKLNSKNKLTLLYFTFLLRLIPYPEWTQKGSVPQLSNI